MTFSKWIHIALIGAVGASLSVAQAKEGAMGNGGDAVVRRVGPVIQSAVLYDFWEQQHRHGFTYKANATPALQQALDILRENLGDSPFYDELQKNVRAIAARTWPVPSKDQLAAVKDEGYVLLPDDGREILQLANYVTDTEMLVNSRIWAKLGPSNRAGFYLHEAIYLWDRATNGATTSEFTREAVARLFSVQSLSVEMQKSFMVGPYGKGYHCEVSDGGFQSAYDLVSSPGFGGDNKLWRIRFTQIQGIKRVLVFDTANIPGFDAGTDDISYLFASTGSYAVRIGVKWDIEDTVSVDLWNMETGYSSIGNRGRFAGKARCQKFGASRGH